MKVTSFNGVAIKVYGEETSGAISIIEQPFEPGLLLPPHVHENDVWLYVLEGEMHARVATRSSRRHPAAGSGSLAGSLTPCGTRR